jgi:hypothetical protein
MDANDPDHADKRTAGRLFTPPSRAMKLRGLGARAAIAPSADGWAARSDKQRPKVPAARKSRQSERKGQSSSEL